MGSMICSQKNISRILFVPVIMSLAGLFVCLFVCLFVQAYTDRILTVNIGEYSTSLVFTLNNHKYWSGLFSNFSLQLFFDKFQ